MTTAQKKQAYILPERYRKALENIQAAGGSASNFMLDLIEKAEQKGMSDEDVAQILRDHYQNNEH